MTFDSKSVYPANLGDLLEMMTPMNKMKRLPLNHGEWTEY